MGKNTCRYLSFIFIMAIPFFLISVQVMGQKSYEGLNPLRIETVHCYYSKGQQERAVQISGICSGAMKYYNEMLGFEPEVDLLVLSKADWSKHTQFPVYGMPHYTDKKTLIVAAEDNEFWQSFIPPIDGLPKQQAERIKKAYGNAENKISMKPFFDLLVLHELGHAYYQQAGIEKQRFWLSEFFSNLFLHTYVAEKIPHQLPALQVFPEMVIAGGSQNFTFTTLDQLEKNYSMIAQRHPKNYGWYQSRWHKGAGEVYDLAGKEVLLNFWKAMSVQKAVIDEPLLANFLRTIHPSLSAFYENWEKE